MKGFASILALGIVGMATAQKPRTEGEGKFRPPPSALRPSGSRVDAILGFASDRLTTQVDVMFDDGDYPAVISLLRLQAEQYPGDYDLWTNLGWMQENVEAWDAALATYVRYRRQNPNDPDASLPEANFYFMKKVYAKVPPLMEPAIKGPCHANCFRILARAYEKQNMLGDAARVYKALIARDDDATAKANLKRIEGKMQSGVKL